MTSILTTTLFAIFVNSVGGLHHDTLISNVALRQDEDFRQKQTTFFALQIAGGHIGLAFVLLSSVFARNIRRDPTFFNFCITWIFSSIVFSILLYQGTEGHTIEFPFGIHPDLPSDKKCILQAALTSGVQVMTAGSTMSLVIQMWLKFHAAIHGPHDPNQTRWTMIGLLVTPYILLLAFSLPVIAPEFARLSGRNLSWRAAAFPSNFYCMPEELNSFPLAVYGAMLGILVITLILDVCIISVLYRHLRVFRHVQTGSPVSISVVVRVILFSLYRVAAAVAYGVVLIKRPRLVRLTSLGILPSVGSIIPIWVDMLQATIPLVVFLIFGLNKDVIHAFKFWHKKHPAAQTLHSVDVTGITAAESAGDKQAILEGRNP